MKGLSLTLALLLLLFACSMETNIDSSEIVLNPSCTKYGIRINVIDGITYSILLEPTGHSTTKTEVDGGYKYACSKCNASWTEKTIHSHLLENEKCISCSFTTKCTHNPSTSKSWIRYIEKDYYAAKCSKCTELFIIDAELGATGPAGGIIFYDCDKDNDSGNSDGLTSSTAGWRYLEASRSFLVLNGTEPTIDSSLSNYNSLFNCKNVVPHVFINDIENMPTAEESPSKKYVQSGIFFDMFYRDEPGSSNKRVTSETAIGKGNENTLTLVTKKGRLGEHAYFKSVEELKSSYYPANLCYHLKSNNNGVVYDDWFLPSHDELNALLADYATAYTLGKGEYVWSSSESGITATYAAKISDSGTFAGMYSRSRGETVSAKLTHGSRIIPIRSF